MNTFYRHCIHEVKGFQLENKIKVCLNITVPYCEASSPNTTAEMKHALPIRFMTVNKPLHVHVGSK